MTPAPPNRIKQLVVHAGFFGLLVFAWSAGRVAPESANRSFPGKRFREVGAESGIDFHHAATTVYPRVGNIAAQITAVGASVSVCDANGDGQADLYAGSSGDGAANALYLNHGDGTFREAAEEAGLAALNVPGELACMGSVWAD